VNETFYEVIKFDDLAKGPSLFGRGLRENARMPRSEELGGMAKGASSREALVKKEER